MDGLRETIEVLQSEAADYPFAVRVWMRTMAISFFAGIVFVPWKPGARWVVSVMALTAAGLIIGKALLPDLSRDEIGATLHLTLWPIVLFVLWRPASRHKRHQSVTQRFDGIYDVWLVWVSVLVMISLILDFRTVLLRFV